MPSISIFGLKACDTTRAALKALMPKGAELHDLRAEPVSRQVLEVWLEQFGDALVNRSSTTWRGLDEAERTRPPLDLLEAHPTLIKRPVITDGDKLTLGWKPDAQAVWL